MRNVPVLSKIRDLELHQAVGRQSITVKIRVKITYRSVITWDRDCAFLGLGAVQITVTCTHLPSDLLTPAVAMQRNKCLYKADNFVVSVVSHLGRQQ